MELAERVALVTGAGRRVGQAIAIELGRRGMHVAVHYHGSREGADGTVAAVSAHGARAAAIPADLMRPESAPELVRRTIETFGAIDVLVNSAAIMLRTPLDEVTPATWDEIFALNLRAPFFLAREAAARMPPGSAIVNIADLAAFEAWPAYVPHGISKAGVVHLTKSLARVLAPKVRVNAVAPGVVLLPEGCDESSAERLRSTTPLQRHGEPGDVARAVAYLLEADFVTGEVLLVDGGRHVRR
jgi:pteridine reductase